MQNKSHTSASVTQVFSIGSVVAVYQLRLEISAFFKNLIFRKREVLARRVKELVQFGLAALVISGVFLACSWLFLVQLAEYGWQ